MYLPNSPDLAKFLSLLPNLETLEVLARYRPGSNVGHSFESVKLPQIRMLVICSYTHYLMKCCTNATRVVIHQRQDYGVTYLESVSFVADSLVYLALCLPTSEHIEGAGDFDSSLSML